jgi:type VI secretion system protein VasI
MAIAAGESCIKVENDLDRLSCYDKELGRTPFTAEMPAPAQSAWAIAEESSKLTDEKTVMLQSLSDEEINCGWNKGAKIKLLLICKEGVTSLIFVTDCHMTSSEYDDYGTVEYRLDTEKAKKFAGVASTDHKALGLWSGAKSIPVIKQMMGKTKLVARMTPFSESPFTATFGVYGLKDAISPLRSACGW